MIRQVGNKALIARCFMYRMRIRRCGNKVRKALFKQKGKRVFIKTAGIRRTAQHGQNARRGKTVEVNDMGVTSLTDAAGAALGYAERLPHMVNALATARRA